MFEIIVYFVFVGGGEEGIGDGGVRKWVVIFKISYLELG